ncbi:alpha/beta hydrolase family protein [Neobacillus cucumis]|uniref:alpha/beta hydrolase family protein n=1 Tax=Neobacillus cucumis TaxID=1740721 RepID=UPI0028534EA7|nr:alpha/beta hydrolase [Neobacillus cucumis]MDR4946561.1 alpha/beta hydrolase [Neobacillus cucumis]
MVYKIKEENAVIQSEVKLSGTLTVPIGTEEVYPAVLIIPGSGGSDRDGNSPKFKMGIYKDLAEFLTGLGFVTLRYDKRGTHQSEGDAYTRGFRDLANDATAALHYLKRHPKVNENQTIILGHSEGAQLSPAVYAQEPSAGVILLCGGAMPMQEIINWQRQQGLDALNQLGGFKGWLIRTLNATEKARKTNAKFDEKILNSTKETIRVFGKKFPAKWLREFYQYDVFADLRQITCPVLVIAGEKDCQVPLAASEQVIPTVLGEAELHVIKDMTHILKCWPGNMDASNPLKIYKQLFEEPLPEEFRNCLSAWLGDHFIAKKIDNKQIVGK